MKKSIFPIIMIGLMGLIWRQAIAEKSDPIGIGAVISWPRMSAGKFGCMLEQTFGHQDKEYNCTTQVSSDMKKGDPCKNTKDYYAGPQFPQKAVTKVHPLIKRIDLAWEHKDLQSVTILFKKKMTQEEVAKLLTMPLEPPYPHDNLMNVEVQSCGKDETCLILTGFDHMGAGEVDCGAIE